MSGNISRPNNNCPGVVCNMLWYEHLNAYTIEARILIHGETASNVTALVLSMLPRTW